MPVDTAAEVLSMPGVKYTMVPQQTMKFAEFMYRVGTIKVKAESWKDYFFPEIHDLPGS